MIANIQFLWVVVGCILSDRIPKSLKSGSGDASKSELIIILAAQFEHSEVKSIKFPQTILPY